MFITEISLKIENLRITNARADGTITTGAEDPRSCIADDGESFEFSAWSVAIGYNHDSHRKTISVYFKDGDKKRYSRHLPLESDGTLLLGHDAAGGKLRSHFLRDDAVSELCSRFGITAITEEDPNTAFAGNWSSPNYDGDWEMIEVVSDGDVEDSVPADERLGHYGKIRFIVDNATWAIVCRKSYKDSQRACSYELHTELSAREMIQILEAYLSENDMVSLGDIFEAWGLE